MRASRLAHERASYFFVEASRRPDGIDYSSSFQQGKWIHLNRAPAASAFMAGGMCPGADGGAGGVGA
jgi:hypothetical protein